MNHHVAGLFDEPEAADRAIKDLLKAGFPASSISLLMADPNGALYHHQAERPEGTKAGEGAAAGITSGAVVGGLLGLLIGVGLFFVPIGLVAAGPIAGLLAGGTAGATTGGLLGSLIGVGVAETEADIYAECVHRGGTLVTVEAEDDRVEIANQILSGDGAIDINDRASKLREEGFIRYDPTAPGGAAVKAHVEHERAVHDAGGMDEAQAERERIYGSGPSTGAGSFNE